MIFHNPNNELDMLEIRLNVLNDYVDYFVIVESIQRRLVVYLICTIL